jgi:hypothetical protein
MSLPEASAEANEDTCVEPNGHGEKLHHHDAGLVTIDSPGEMSEVEEAKGDGSAHEEHEEDEGDQGSEENDQGNSEDDEDNEDEDDEDEDEEPALKYERIGGSVSDLLKKDSASALAISNKIMVRPQYNKYHLTILIE